MLLGVPLKYSIAMTMEYLNGKSAIRIHRKLMRTRGTLFGRIFWSRGYCVSAVGLDKALIRQYIKNQEKHERDQERVLFDDIYPLIQRPLFRVPHPNERISDGVV